MSAKHTPGPWEAYGSEMTTRTGVRVAYPRNGVKTICVIRACEEDWANARLIAEAPAMLEALRSFIRGDERAEVGSNQCLQNMIDDARAILARIEGGKS